MLSKSARIQEYLMQEIASGHAVPGSRIPSRHRLTAKFQCSRTVVERAIAALVRSGHLTSRQGSGTFVASTEPDHRLRTLRLISNRYAMGSVFFSPILAPGDEAELPIILYSRERAHQMPESLALPGSAVVWDAPGPQFLDIMEYLRHLRIPQLFLNRTYAGFDWISTDVNASIREGLSWLLIEGGRDIAFVSHGASLLRPYLAERIIAFFTIANELKARLNPDYCILGTSEDLLSQVNEIGLRLFGNASKCPKGIFVMNCEMVLPLVVAAQSYGLKLGEDFRILTFDEVPELAGHSGLGMMRQRFDLFGKEIRRWLTDASSRSAKPFQIFIKTELITT